MQQKGGGFAMKRWALWTLLFPLFGFSQTILLDKDVSAQQSIPKWGANRKFDQRFSVAYGWRMPAFWNRSSEMRGVIPASCLIGFSWNFRASVFKGFSVGAQASFLFHNINLSNNSTLLSDAGVWMPGATPDRFRYIKRSLSAAPFLRYRWPSPKGDDQGIFLDLGARLEWFFSNALKVRGEPGAMLPPASSTLVIWRNLEYFRDWSSSVWLRFGRSKQAIIIQHVLSTERFPTMELFGPGSSQSINGKPNMPSLIIGIEQYF
jgi:hypothetical protein